MALLQCDTISGLPVFKSEGPTMERLSPGESYLYIDADLELAYETWGGYPWEVQLWAIGNCFDVSTELNRYDQDVHVARALFRRALKPSSQED